jgi:hypothetical protein
MDFVRVQVVALAHVEWQVLVMGEVEERVNLVLAVGEVEVHRHAASV